MTPLHPTVRTTSAGRTARTGSITLATSIALVGGLLLTPPAGADTSDPNATDSNATTGVTYTYAAIGDSATVAGSWFGSKGDRCGRNISDYPTWFATYSGLTLRETACYDATTSNYQWTRRAGILNYRNAPQAQAIDKNTRVVTIQLGLRDIIGGGSSSLLSSCLPTWVKQNASIVSGRPTDVTGSPCKDRYGVATMKKFDGLKARLTTIYRDAKNRAGRDALIVAVGYAPLFNDTRGCWSGWLIPPRDRQFYNDIYEKLNTTISAAAQQAGIESFIPAAKKLGSYSSCGLPGVRRTSFTGLPEAAYPMGPTPAGQAYIATSLYQMWQDWMSLHPTLH